MCEDFFGGGVKNLTVYPEQNENIKKVNQNLVKKLTCQNIDSRAGTKQEHLICQCHLFDRLPSPALFI